MNKTRSDKGAKRVLDNAKMRCIRLTDLDYAKFRALGGIQWLRIIINQLKTALTNILKA